MLQSNDIFSVPVLIVMCAFLEAEKHIFVGSKNSASSKLFLHAEIEELLLSIPPWDRSFWWTVRQCLKLELELQYKQLYCTAQAVVRE